MTIQQCKYILKIAECGSLNEAAKQLFVAQSSLSVSVKTLEQELGAALFERSGNGVYLTAEGAEFVRYARQLAAQHDFILDRFAADRDGRRLYISTQHYDFVADLFANLLNETQEPRYRFSLREMKTYDVIHETESARSDIGVIAIKGSDYSLMERYLEQKRLSFTPLLKTRPHVYLRKTHPLAVLRPASLAAAALARYPCVSYEQGEHAGSFFTEEIVGAFGDRQVEISDRASLLNVLLATDGYTIGTGIMPSRLNGGRIVSIPFESDDHYTVGYLLRMDGRASPPAAAFIQLLDQAAAAYQEEGQA